MPTPSTTARRIALLGLAATCLAPLVSGQGIRVSRPFHTNAGASGGDVSGPRITPDGAQVFYDADLALGGTGTYRVPIGGGSSVAVGGAPGTFTPDGSRYVYVESMCFDFCGTELLSAPTDGSAAATSLDYNIDLLSSPPLTFAISADNQSVVFVVQTALYRVPIDGSAARTLLSRSADGQVQHDFRLSADGSRAVYRTSLDALYSVPVDGSALPVRLSNPPFANRAVIDFRITPDSGRAVYLADADVNERFELYARALDGSGSVVQLSGSLVTGGDVQSPFSIGPDGTWVAYVADALVDERFELLRAPLDGSSAPLVLSGTLTAGGDVRLGFGIDAAGQRIVFRADQDLDERYELYGVPADGSAAAVKLNTVPVAGGDVTSFALPAAGARVVYLADQSVDERFELYSVPTNGSATPLVLSGAASPDADVQSDYQIGPVGAAVFFRLDRDVDEQFQLFRCALTGAGGLLECNGPLAAGGDVQTGFSLTQDGEHLVYLADERTDDVVELFAFDFSARIRLNAALDPGPITGDVTGFLPTRAGERVVYRADRDLDEVFELYGAALDGAPDFVKLNPPLAGSKDVSSFTLTPDGQRALYWANQDDAASVELYSVPSDASLAAVKLNGLLAGGSVRYGFQSPDGSRVLYLANQVVGGYGLFAAPTDGSSSALRLSSPLPAGRSIYRIAATPDGSRAVYEVSEVQSGQLKVLQIWSAPIDGSQAALLLTPPLVASGQIWDRDLSPDGSRVVYLADQEIDERFELFSVPTDGSAAAVKLNSPLVAGGDVSLMGFESFEGCAIAISRDSSRVVYFADQDTDDIEELYSVPIDASAAPVKLNGPLVAGGEVGQPYVLSFAITANSSRVLYLADQEVNGRAELFSTPIDGSALPAKLNTSGYSVSHFQLSPDGRWAAYRAQQSVFSAPFELFASPSDGSQSPRRLSGPMVAGGNVRLNLFAASTAGLTPSVLSGSGGFTISSDSRRVIYSADQESDEVQELFLGLLGKPTWRTR